MQNENGNGNGNGSDEKKVNALDSVGRVMAEFRDDMQRYNVIGTRIAARTKQIIRLVVITLFISSIYIIFLIYKMSVNMGVMTQRLDSMYANFGTMADDMHQISLLVDLMGNSVSGIPGIAGSMTSMNEFVSAMNGSVDGMNRSMSTIDNNMALVDSSMREMSGRMANMNGAVNSMSQDVFQMSKPMNSGPMSGFWPH